MGGTFNPQILTEKLAKLNNSQQSIETLSHWCIFHMSKAKLVVETWDRQFHCSPRDQRLAFLYLANDILQNSRRKGSEFVVEFWKVLPEALRDVIENGDDFGRNAAMRLIGIWEDRKVFGSRGQILKEEFVHGHIEKKDEKHFNIKLKHGFGNTVDKVVAGYQAIYGGEFDEDVIMRRCENATIFVEKVAKEVSGSINSGEQHEHEHEILEELQGQQDVLKDCVEQLEAVESSRASLVIHLREALQEQEVRLGQVRSQLLAAQVHAKRAGDMCQRLASGRLYNPEESTVGNSEDDSRRPSAAEMAARLTASTSSAEMLSFVLSSLASEGILVNGIKDVPVDYPLEKRPKTEDKPISYMPTPSSLHEVTNELPPPPPSSSAAAGPPGPLPPPPPLLPPMLPYGMPQIGQAGGSMPGLPYGYVMNHQQPPSHPGRPMFPATAMSTFPLLSASSYQQFQGPGSGFYDQQSSCHAHLPTPNS